MVKSTIIRMNRAARTVMVMNSCPGEQNAWMNLHECCGKDASDANAHTR
jgi:hypothetical protein